MHVSGGSFILLSMLTVPTLLGSAVSRAARDEPIDPGSSPAVVTAGPSPINVYEDLTITVTCPAPPDLGANAAVVFPGTRKQLSPGTVIGNAFTVVYPVPTGAGDDLTVYGSCVSQAASASTSNGVLIDVIPLQVPTPFAVPASITVTPPQIHPGEVVHVDVRCSGAPPTQDMSVWTRADGALDDGVNLLPYVRVVGNGYTVDLPIPAGAPLGRWRLEALCDVAPDVVIPGAPPYDFTRYFTVSAAPSPSVLPTLPTTL